MHFKTQVIQKQPRSLARCLPPTLWARFRIRRRPWGSAALHPRLYAATRLAGWSKLILLVVCGCVTVLDLTISPAYAQDGVRTPTGGASAAPSVKTGPQAQPAPETTVTVNEQFLNAFLDSMFANLNAPSVPLIITPSDKDRSPAEAKACPNLITLQREEGGVRTAIKLEQGKITAPLAFAGSYNSTLLGCIEFRGWANTSWTLEFDRPRQALVARVQVDEIHLTNVPALAGGSLGKLVQAAIDKRINPLELVRLDQLSTRVPIAAAGGALRMRAKEVRPEIVPGAVHLQIVYEFLPDR